LLGWIVVIVIIGTGLMLDHGLELLTFLHQFLIEFLQLIPLSCDVLHLLSQSMQVVLFVLNHMVYGDARYQCGLLLLILQQFLLLLQLLVEEKLFIYACLQLRILHHEHVQLISVGYFVGTSTAAHHEMACQVAQITRWHAHLLQLELDGGVAIQLRERGHITVPHRRCLTHLSPQRSGHPCRCTTYSLLASHQSIVCPGTFYPGRFLMATEACVTRTHFSQRLIKLDRFAAWR
jgi:hypothetical protein